MSMMEESQYLMWIRRKQVLKAHLQTPFGDGNNYYSSWEERAFAEDAARILGGSSWPPRSYSCTFCKREFRSAQALGGHMNVHRRDRARLKQNLSPHNNHEALDHHHKNDYNSLLGENCGQHAITPYSSSIIRGQKMGFPISEPASEGVINAREENFKGLLDCDDSSVETSLSVGLSSMFGQKSSPSTVPCRDHEAIISCKRLKTTISSRPLCLKPCSKDRSLAFQSAEMFLGLNPGMEDLDLELRLGKQQKVVQ